MIYIAGIVYYVTFVLMVSFLCPDLDYWDTVKLVAAVTAIVIGFAWSCAYLILHL